MKKLIKVDFQLLSLTTYVNVFLFHVMFGLDGDALETKTRVKSAAHELNKNIMFYLHIPALSTGGVTKTLQSTLITDGGNFLEEPFLNSGQQPLLTLTEFVIIK